jgi:hypothetical protein
MFFRNRNDFVTVLESSYHVLWVYWFHLWVIVDELDALIDDRIRFLILVELRHHGVLFETGNLLVVRFCVSHNSNFELGTDLKTASIFGRKVEYFFLQFSVDEHGISSVEYLDTVLAFLFDLLQILAVLLLVFITDGVVRIKEYYVDLYVHFFYHLA